MSSATSLPVTPWSLEEHAFTPGTVELHQTLFAQANGYIGTRGSVEEGYVEGISSCEGTYLNGVYHREPIEYGESAYGFATHNQKMLQVPNGKWLQLQVDGEPLYLSSDAIVDYQRHLDLKTGLLSRQTTYQLRDGKQLRLNIERFVSLEHQQLMLLKLSVTPLNFAGHVELLSGLDAAYRTQGPEDDPRAGQLAIEDALEFIGAEVSDSACHMLHKAKDAPFEVISIARHSDLVGFEPCGQLKKHSQVGVHLQTNLSQGQSASLTKWLYYFHQDYSHKDDSHQEHEQTQGDHAAFVQQAQDELDSWMQQDFATHLATHTQIFTEFLQHSDIQLAGDDAVQQGLRFNQFHLFQSSGRNAKSAIAAKGLSGPGYDGHYFWDTEIYIIPSLTYTQPALAKQLLLYRANILDSARQRARQMSHDKGALFAWRTIGGEECSAYYPASTAQYHINAAVAYAFLTYVKATDDWQLMWDAGAEVIFETARLWADLGHFNPRKQNQFCIDGVTGPDEYTAVVNNNFYTNAMAQLHLRFALQVAERFAKEQPQHYQALLQQLELTESELSDWQRMAENMYLPYDDELQIHLQDDQFLDKKPWDFANTPKDKYPLLLHFHPLVIYRHQVLKQADVILAMFLLDDAFDAEQKRRNLAYYEPLTTHDSTLSACIYGMVNAEVGQHEQAVGFLRETARMDLDNLHHNTEYGIHTACMAGSWNTLVFGFAGARLRDDGLHFKPFCPANWQSYQFCLQVKDAVVEVQVNPAQTQYRLKQGDGLDLQHQGHKLSLSSRQPRLIVPNS